MRRVPVQSGAVVEPTFRSRHISTFVARLSSGFSQSEAQGEKLFRARMRHGRAVASPIHGNERNLHDWMDAQGRESRGDGGSADRRCRCVSCPRRFRKRNGNGNGNGNGSPTTVPGSPGDDCSHGNSGKDCRPDPNQNGKDCEDHGNAKGNEDHCDQGETTTTVPTTTNETTTTTKRRRRTRPRRRLRKPRRAPPRRRPRAHRLRATADHPEGRDSSVPEPAVSTPAARGLSPTGRSRSTRPPRSCTTRRRSSRV